MHIYTLGFTKKDAKTFFSLIADNNIELLIDIRLNNSSQLAGFTKGSDLSYFLESICGCRYRYEPLFAPTKELMERMKSGVLNTGQFDEDFISLMKERGAVARFAERYGSESSVCLLCSEATPDICHRRVLADMLAKAVPGREVIHL